MVSMEFRFKAQASGFLQARASASMFLLGVA